MYKNYNNLTIEEKKYIYYLIYNKPSHVKTLLKTNQNKLYNNILEYTKEYENIIYTERLYIFINEEKGKCTKKNCNNFVKFQSVKLGYRNFCSVSCASSDEIVQKLKKETNLKNCGFDCNLKSNNTKNQIKNTNLEKYGVEYFSKSKEFKNKIETNNLNKYGILNTSQKNIRNYKRYNKDFFEKYFVINNEINFDLVLKYYNIKEVTLYRFLKKNNIKYLYKKENKKSKNEKKIFNFLNNLLNLNNNNLNVIKNEKNIIKDNRKKLELDIYIPNKKIAIEYNGLMFHSFGKSKYSMFNNYKNESLHKKKHLIKTELCEKQNIQLLHINEDEWLNQTKQKIWKSMIKSKLGLLDKKIFARKTIIKEISYKEAKGFLINNHIQGESVSKINLGLFPKNDSSKLIGIMTFGKPRYSKSADWELIRFCSQLDLNIVGGGSKLLNYFTSKYMQNGEQLISYGNRRWTYSKKNFYIINGFEFIENSNINYYYFHEKNLTRLYHRSVFQKHKIERYYNNSDKLIFNFDKSLTERINMYNNGYRKIFDCGQLVYRYIKQ